MNKSTFILLIIISVFILYTIPQTQPYVVSFFVNVRDFVVVKSVAVARSVAAHPIWISYGVYISLIGGVVLGAVAAWKGGFNIWKKTVSYGVNRAKGFWGGQTPDVIDTVKPSAIIHSSPSPVPDATTQLAEKEAK